MKRLTAFLRSIRLRQILTVFLVGIVLVLNTACNRAVGKTPGSNAYEDSSLKGLPGQVEPEISGSSRIKTKPETGMNSYPDVDPRLKTTEAERKAQGLVEDSQGNLEKRADSPEKYVQNYKEGTPLGKRVENIGKDIGSSTDQVKGEAQQLGSGAQRNVDATANRVRAKASDTARDVRQASKNTADRAQYKTNEAIDDTQEASGNILNRVTKSVKRATEDASDFVQNKTDEAAKGTQRAAEDAADAARRRT